jgi:hypothetical protein
MTLPTFSNLYGNGSASDSWEGVPPNNANATFDNTGIYFSFSSYWNSTATANKKVGVTKIDYAGNILWSKVWTEPWTGTSEPVYFTRSSIGNPVNGVLPYILSAANPLGWGYWIAHELYYLDCSTGNILQSVRLYTNGNGEQRITYRPALNQTSSDASIYMVFSTTGSDYPNLRVVRARPDLRIGYDLQGTYSKRIVDTTGIQGGSADFDGSIGVVGSTLYMMYDMASVLSSGTEYIGKYFYANASTGVLSSAYSIHGPQTANQMSIYNMGIFNNGDAYWVAKNSGIPHLITTNGATTKTFAFDRGNPRNAWRNLDGTYYLVLSDVYNAPLNGQYSGIVILKLDASGNILWQKAAKYTNPYNYLANTSETIFSLPTGGVCVVKPGFYVGYAVNAILVLLLDASGDVVNYTGCNPMAVPATLVQAVAPVKTFTASSAAVTLV